MTLLRKLALALPICLLPGLALAQQGGLPAIELPPGTVIGNSQPVTAFGQAIPFSVLGPLVLQNGIPLATGSILVGGAGNLAVPQVVSGDCSLSFSGVMICTKSNGTSFAPSATTDTTNATNISTGNLSVNRLNSGTSAGAQTYWRGDGQWTGINLNSAAVSSTLQLGNGGTGQTTLAAFLATFAKPTTQTFLSGSGTYTTPANATWIEIELLGGGGGGGGSGTTPGAATAGGNSCWNTSGAACTTPVYQAGGGALGGTVGTPSAGGTISGSGTCNIMALPGGAGQAGSGSASVPGGNGGVSKFGGSGWAGGPGQAGAAAATNSGSGGGGAGDSATPNTGSGGAAGAYCRTIISSPAASYTYAVGAAGAAGTAGTSGSAGAAGGAGGIYVIEHYN